MRFPAFLDTNVLYGALLNDCFLTLAEHGLFRPLWSELELKQLRRNLNAALEHASLVEKRITTMRTFFPDAMVTGYESIVDRMTNDPKDRHVLAAAVRGGAEVLVTFNTRDFPSSSTDAFEIDVVHPDDFLLDQLDLHQAATLRAIVTLVARYDSPSMTTHDYLLALTRSGVPRFADALRDRLE